MFVTQTTLPSKLQLRGTAWRPSHAGQTRLQLFSPPRHPPRPSLFQANANTRVQTAPKLIAFRMYLTRCKMLRLSFELPRRLHLTRLLVCPAYEYQTTRMQRSRPGSSLFSPSPSVEGRSSVEARDRTRPTPRSRARRLVHAFTPSARREQVPQSCSPPATEPGYLGGHLSPSC